MAWWLAAAVALIVLGILSLRQQSTPERETVETLPRDSLSAGGTLRTPGQTHIDNAVPPPPPEPLTETALTQGAVESPETFPDDAFNRTVLMREVVDSLRRYAAEAGPDDPFAMTEEQIKSFESRGQPYLW